MHYCLSVRDTNLFKIKHIFLIPLFLIIVISPSFSHFFSSPLLRLLLLCVLPSTPTPRFASYSLPPFVLVVLVLVIPLAPPVFLYFVLLRFFSFSYPCVFLFSYFLAFFIILSIYYTCLLCCLFTCSSISLIKFFFLQKLLNFFAIWKG